MYSVLFYDITNQDLSTLVNHLRIYKNKIQCEIMYHNLSVYCFITFYNETDYDNFKIFWF